MNLYEQIQTQPQRLIILDREYHDEGTHGTLIFPDGTTFDTLENPWLNNERRISCIPEGEYELEMRYSPIVKSTSGGEYSRGWEITDVPGRTYIMCHVGNYTKDTAGCLLIGSSKDFQGDKPVIWRSRDAFREFMTKMAEHDSWFIVVREKR